MLAANLLKLARQRSGLSLRELGRRAGTSHATLAAYEAGRKTPTVDTLERIVQATDHALDVSLNRRIRGNPDYHRGQELADALELASVFPSKHPRTMPYPKFSQTG